MPRARFGGMPSPPLVYSRTGAQLKCSLIIPTFNERENLAPLFQRIDRALRGCDFEVILVDDDSPDLTWEAAQAFQAQYSWLRVIRRQKERGLSSAVICGFRQARGLMLAVMDSDLQHDENKLPALFGALENADFAIATRHSAGGSEGKWPWPRRFTSWTATLLARAIAHVSLSDPMSGFFAMRRSLFEALDDGGLRPRGYKVLLYLYASAIARFGADNLRLREIGYEFGNRHYGKSKLSGKVVFEYVLMLLALRWQTQRAHATPSLRVPFGANEIRDWARQS